MKLPKDFETFYSSLALITVPNEWPKSLQSLWFIAKGDWESSHNIAQDLHTKMGSWIHAHLHRVEGDRFNAGYWYRQADRPYCDTSFDDEIKEIVSFVLKDEK